MLFLCRNRLESNTEHWNALLLSLRELIEWVIRKDTELTGLGPVCGDVAALQKQQVSRRTLFRAQITWVPLRRVSVGPYKICRRTLVSVYSLSLGDEHAPFNILCFRGNSINPETSGFEPSYLDMTYVPKIDFIQSSSERLASFCLAN